MAGSSAGATYVVGDVHGCFATLEHLLREIPLEWNRDRLWLTGDLVNRGTHSLEVLRWAQGASRRLGDRFVAVLGNHDLHLLSTAAGFGRPHHGEAFAKVLEAPDRSALIEWLAERPLMHREQQTVLVHAGLFPEWSVDEAAEHARALEAILRHEPRRRGLLRALRDPASMPRELYAFTCLRLLDEDGTPVEYNGPPTSAPPGCLPWFEVPGRRSRGALILAGHWAALGLRIEDGFLGLDSGCVYGGSLSAVRLEDRRIFSTPNAEPAPAV